MFTRFAWKICQGYYELDAYSMHSLFDSYSMHTINLPIMLHVPSLLAVHIYVYYSFLVMCHITEILIHLFPKFVTVPILLLSMIVLVGTDIRKVLLWHKFLFGMKKQDFPSKWPSLLRVSCDKASILGRNLLHNKVISKFVESSNAKNIIEPINIIANVKKINWCGLLFFLMKIKTSTKIKERK